ncbi:phage portal protein [Oxalicibacterium faecigallinarum]|uniref:Portal protein n=1 Tax=Oxalicibacterium faecigallinarum TaxID=573741 RepID=A0A8J3EYY0_9BURK|nr:phage portal protein [Oxalicibacterium faecigallinarum]GGI16430.1 portal protein [Oxalicibacterium faecigallinarum]
MANFLTSVRTWFGGGAIAEREGDQARPPTTVLIPDTRSVGEDGALQIDTVWACIDRRASAIASLPFFVYEAMAGEKKLARNARLYQLLHDSPNARMTPFEFWRAMVMNHDLRGNAYARIQRDSADEPLALWPMPSSQVKSVVLPSGDMVYEYRFGNDVAVLAADNVLHIKNLGNGTTGLDKLEFMRAGLDEVSKAQEAASRMFANGGKPSGVLMIDKVLKPDQRDAVRRNFEQMTEGPMHRLHVLEAGMEYEQISLSPEQIQLLQTRQYAVETICRWYDVPPVLIHHSNVTAWGSGIEQIVNGFYTLSLRPLTINIEQAVQKRVLTSRQRARYKVEFSMDALLRANPKDRAEIHAKYSQNGIMTRAEIRQLEGLPHMAGTDELTAQSNLAPLHMLGKTPQRGGAAISDIAQ